MSSGKKRKKEKIKIKVSHKKPRDPIAKEVKKKHAGPMKDRRKENKWQEEENEEYDVPPGNLYMGLKDESY